MSDFILQPWQKELMQFLSWLKEKHPEVQVSLIGSPRRGYNAMMRRLREEYAADIAPEERMDCAVPPRRSDRKGR